MDRLQSNERARVQQIERRMKARLEQGDLLKDLVGNFTSEFNRGKQGIIRQLERMRTLDESELSGAFDALVPRMAALQERLNEGVIFLPGFELRVARESLQHLEALIAKTRRAVFPNSRFRFSAAARATLRDAAEGDDGKTHAPPPAVSTTQQQAEADVEVSEESIGSFADRDGVVLSYGRCAHTDSVVLTDYTLARLTDCVVSLCAPASSMRMHRLKRCRVYCAPVAGSVHIEECEDCIFVLASRQVRMHTSVRCDLYLHVKSGPIIEHCTAVRFAPYNLEYEALQDNLKTSKLDFPPSDSKWHDVQDFRWLRSQKSPNWEEVPVHERVPRCAPVLNAAERERDDALWKTAGQPLKSDPAALLMAQAGATDTAEEGGEGQGQGQGEGTEGDADGSDEEEWEM